MWQDHSRDIYRHGIEQNPYCHNTRPSHVLLSLSSNPFLPCISPPHPLLPRYCTPLQTSDGWAVRELGYYVIRRLPVRFPGREKWCCVLGTSPYLPRGISLYLCKSLWIRASAKWLKPSLYFCRRHFWNGRRGNKKSVAQATAFILRQTIVSVHVCVCEGSYSNISFLTSIGSSSEWSVMKEGE